MYIKIVISFLLVFSAYAQSIYTLSECSYYIKNAANPATTKIEFNSGKLECFFDGNTIEIDRTIYNDIPISCSNNFPNFSNGDKACTNSQVCNLETTPPTCIEITDPLLNAQAENGAGLFNSGQNASPCHVLSSGKNLTIADVDNISFVPEAAGINDDCRELMKIYQLQLGRSSATGTFSLPTSTSGI